MATDAAGTGGNGRPLPAGHSDVRAERLAGRGHVRPVPGRSRRRCPRRGASSSPTTGRPAWHRSRCRPRGDRRPPRLPESARRRPSAARPAAPPVRATTGRAPADPRHRRTRSTGAPTRPPQRRGLPAAEPAEPPTRCAVRPVASWPTWRPRSAVPTATSVRVVPAKLLEVNRTIVNNQLGPDHRRQGQLHPPDRVRRGQGTRRGAGHERRLRGRCRRQGDARGRPAPSRRSRAGRRRREVRREPHPARAVHHRRRHRDFRRLRERPTRS